MFTGYRPFTIRPQATTVPSRFNARLYSRFAAIETTAVRTWSPMRTWPDETLGEFVVGLPVAWPKVLNPQPTTVPSFLSPIEWLAPAAMANTLLKLADGDASL